MNKKVLPVILVVLVVGVLVYLLTQNRVMENNDDVDVNNVSDETGRWIQPTTTEGQPIGKLKVVNFTGKLEEVNTGCFADGECYVVVDGKHITTLLGFNTDTVGSVQGVGSISDLESLIGREVEVYAQDAWDGTYTLYGSEGFYVKVK